MPVERTNSAHGRGRGHIHGLDIFLVRPNVADMREGERDDLTGVGRISQDFLIARHRGIEAHLTDRVPARPDAKAFEYRSIGKHEHGGRARFVPGLSRRETVGLSCVHWGHRCSELAAADLVNANLRRAGAMKGHSRAARSDQHRVEKRHEGKG